MNTAIAPLASPVLFAGALIFVLLFAVIRQVVEQMPLYSQTSKRTVAFCVSLLAVLGMGLGAGHALLVPYAALGLTMLFIMLLGMVWKILRRLRPGPGKVDQDADQVRQTDDTNRLRRR